MKEVSFICQRRGKTTDKLEEELTPRITMHFAGLAVMLHTHKCNNRTVAYPLPTKSSLQQHEAFTCSGFSSSSAQSMNHIRTDAFLSTGVGLNSVYE